MSIHELHDQQRYEMNQDACADDWAVRPGVCSHVWRDARYFGQLVHNLDVAPWEMQKGQEYRCVNCRLVLRP